MAVLTAATAVVWFHSALLAQVQWTQQPTANSPPARRSSALVYDPVRDRTVLFGGRALSNTLGDTWLFDGVDWVQATTPVALGHRQDPMMTWDPVRQRVLVFGGTRLVSGSPPFGGRNNLLSTHYDDTWEWDGNDWLQRAPAVRPSARRFPHAFFDEVRQRVVLTGGNFCTGTSGGTATWSIAIRSDPSLAGLAFHVQGAVFDPAANALGIAASAGLTLAIGGP